MSDDRLARALRSVGDRYVDNNPADFEAFKEGVQRRSRRRGRTWGLVAGTATAAALVAVLFVVARPEVGTTPDPSQPVASQGLSLVAQIQLGSASEEIAGAGSSAFLALRDVPSILRVDSEANEPVWETPLPAEPLDVLQGAEAAWASLPTSSQVARIDPVTGEPRLYDLEPFSGPTRMHVGERALRVVVEEGIVRMSYATRRPELIYSGDAVDIAMGRTAFWVLRRDGVVEAIDLDTGRDAGLLRTTLGPGGEITYLREKIWMGLPHAANLYRLDERTGEIEGVSDLPGDYVDIDAGTGGLWVLTSTASGGGAVSELDPETGDLLDVSYTFASTPLDLSHDDDGIWVSLANGSVVLLDRI